MRYLIALGFLVVLAVNFSASAVFTQTNYASKIEAWRVEQEERLTADTGYLTMVALYFLREGNNSFGTSPLNDLVLSEGPDEIGTFALRDGKVSVQAVAGQTLTIDGETVTQAFLYPRENRATIAIGNLTMWVHYSGPRLAIRVSDKNSPIRRTFTGLRWFPVDEAYRVRARFVPHDPIAAKFANILGDLETYTSSGTVTFMLNGNEITMRPVDRDERLWFIFRDLTSGSETYPAARFLYADPPENGWTTLDFNQAYSPPCAFNPHTTCPLPQPENRLRIRIEAGERYEHSTD